MTEEIDVFNLDWQSPGVSIVFPSWARGLRNARRAMLLGTIARPFLEKREDGRFEIKDSAFTTLTDSKTIEEQAIVFSDTVRQIKSDMRALVKDGLLEEQSGSYRLTKKVLRLGATD